MRRVGVFGGTFDPPHIAHLVMAKRAMEQLILDLVLFIPNNIPPHKTPPVAPPHHRLNMMKLAVEEEKGFQVSDCEIKRGEISYTVDTLLFLKEKEGKNTEFFLLVGEDSAKNLSTWKDYRKILEIAKVAWFPRLKREEEKEEKREVEVDEKKKEEKENGKKESQENETKLMLTTNFIKVEAEILEISSTKIREYIKRGLSVKWLVPDKVIKYIYENGLYR